MKRFSKWTMIISAAFCLAITETLAQEVAVVAPASEAAEGLDLKAVGELFRNAPDAEAFEKDLNDPKIGVNNLDLDDNGEVDYIRVVDEADNDVHVLILQVALSETEFQDVATIEIEKSGQESYTVQLHGNEQIYGPNYYIHPVGVTWATVGFISWLYSPFYRPYRSVYYYGYYPRYWRPWRPLSVSVYRTKHVHIHRSVNYRVTTTSRVVNARRVYTKPRSSVLVKKPLRNPTQSQREFQVRQSKTVRSGGFGGEATRTKTKVTNAAGGEATRTKTTVTGPGGAQATKTRTEATNARGGEVNRTRTKVTGAGGAEASKTRTTATGSRGTEASKTRTSVTSKSGAQVSRSKAKVETPKGGEATRTKTKVTTPSGRTVEKSRTKATSADGSKKARTTTKKTSGKKGGKSKAKKSKSKPKKATKKKKSSKKRKN